MMKKLRKRFVTLTMLSFVFILTIFICCSCIINYRQLVSFADFTLENIVTSGENLHQPRGDNKNKFVFSNGEVNKFMSSGIPMSSFCISSTATPQGGLIDVTTNIPDMNMEEARKILTRIISNAKKRHSYSVNDNFSISGKSGSYRYRWDYNPNSCVIAAIDMSTVMTLLFVGISGMAFTGFCGCILIFIVVRVSAGHAVAPVAESYNRQNQFITDAGHELKTPLTIINANAEILEMDIGENDCLKEITNQTKRLAELTNKLVYLAKMKEGNYQPVKIDFLLSDLVNDVAQEFSAALIKNGKHLETNVTPLLAINGDENSIRHVIGILLDNAIKYSADGSITLSLAKTGNKIILEVSNKADNISPYTTKHMFDRFYRGETSHNTATGGHGLGLSIAKTIAEGNGGKITASSKGDLLTIRLIFPSVGLGSK